jgi:hypothetical protein
MVRAFGRQDLAGHEDLALVARMHAHHVARRQHHEAGIDALLHQVAQVDAVALLAALEHDPALVGAGQQAAGAVDRLDQGHRECR